MSEDSWFLHICVWTFRKVRPTMLSFCHFWICIQTLGTSWRHLPIRLLGWHVTDIMTLVLDYVTLNKVTIGHSDNFPMQGNHGKNFLLLLKPKLSAELTVLKQEFTDTYCSIQNNLTVPIPIYNSPNLIWILSGDKFHTLLPVDVHNGIIMDLTWWHVRHASCGLQQHLPLLWIHILQWIPKDWIPVRQFPPASSTHKKPIQACKQFEIQLHTQSHVNYTAQIYFDSAKQSIPEPCATQPHWAPM